MLDAWNESVLHECKPEHLNGLCHGLGTLFAIAVEDVALSPALLLLCAGFNDGQLAGRCVNFVLCMNFMFSECVFSTLWFTIVWHQLLCDGQLTWSQETVLMWWPVNGESRDCFDLIDVLRDGFKLVFWEGNLTCFKLVFWERNLTCLIWILILIVVATTHLPSNDVWMSHRMWTQRKARIAAMMLQ